MSHTTVAYTGATPGTTDTVTLFSSVTAFPPGGSFHLLGQQWFVYALRTASDGGAATGTIVGSYSVDKGVTWVPFYTKTTADADDDDTPAVGDVVADEVYIGTYKDVRFTYTNAVEALTVFVPHIELHPRKPTSKVRDRSVLVGDELFPVTITGGAVSSWFRLGHRDSQITGSGYSRVHDVLDPTSPATQGTDARRPPSATSANGLPIITVATAALVIPITAARAGTTKWGFWGWIRRNTSADNICSFGTTPGSSANRLYTNVAGSVFRCTIFNSDSSQSRNCDIAASTIDTWQFLTIEYNADFAGDAAITMTRGGSVITPTFSGTLGAVPSSLRSVTGNFTYAAFASGGTFPFIGSLGPNWGYMASAMPGVTEGLLTPAARTALMNFEAPT